MQPGGRSTKTTATGYLNCRIFYFCAYIHIAVRMTIKK